jgi:transposase
VQGGGVAPDVEGHVNRIKMLKRQKYGRAGFELLRKRVLLAR